jgi:hypothetical protein
MKDNDNCHSFLEFTQAGSGDTSPSVDGLLPGGRLPPAAGVFADGQSLPDRNSGVG